MAVIRLEKKSGRTTSVKFANTEGRAVALEYDGYVRVVDEAPESAPKPAKPSTPAPN